MTNQKNKNSLIALSPIKTISLQKEMLGGLTTFLTMSYIIFVNPSILSTQGTGIPFEGALTATIILASLLTIAMGVFADLPFAVAPGMGLNAYFTFTIILKNQIPWPTALGMVFWSGLIFLLISATPIRELIAKSIPQHLRIGASIGIGIFLTFIGLKNSGVVVADPVTFVKLGSIDLQFVLSFIGIIIGGALLAKKHPMALLTPIVALTVVSLATNKTQLNTNWYSFPDFKSLILQLDIWGSLKPALFPAIISICLTDLFDSLSTFVGLSTSSGLIDQNGEPKNLRRGLIIDAFATFGAGLLGTSPGTAYIESGAGIETGARTGWASIVTGLLFLPFLFLAPIAMLVPATATAPVLILVGALMFQSTSRLNISKIEDLIPTFVTIILIPLTFSISHGILWGFILHFVFYILTGRKNDLQKTNYFLAALSTIMLII